MSAICYILVGMPSCGKSTLAAKIAASNPIYKIVSTDQIRAELYGDAIIQGNWQEVETQVLQQIHQHLTAGYPIIYDATNCQQAWRLDLLAKLAKYKNISWIALYVQTPLEQCQLRNQQRQRQVPESVIINMAQCLELSPPTTFEGFAAVYAIAPTDFDEIICKL
ncbi:ATP-binding protein [Aliterella atlantica]|uniref:ATP-binding protein n=1 Tax=Aliterella atlantica TaxID=1827278 RepID=UPI0005D3CE66|nr:ATP-binding protein [Aliterella atlantica]